MNICIYTNLNVIYSNNKNQKLLNIIIYLEINKLNFTILKLFFFNKIIIKLFAKQSKQQKQQFGKYGGWFKFYLQFNFFFIVT